MIPLTTRWRLKAIQALDRRRLRRLCADHPGVSLAEDVSTNFASSHFALAPGARLTLGERVYTERRSHGFHISVAEGAHVEIGADTWVRTDIAPVVQALVAHARFEVIHPKWLQYNPCRTGEWTSTSSSEWR